MTKEKYYMPGSVREALEIAQANERACRFLAGGTDVLVNKFQATDQATCLVDISQLEELKQVEKKDKYLSVGSLVTLADLKGIELIKAEFPLLIESAEQIASPVIRNSATLGGNILCGNRCTFFNQSEWWRKAAGYCLKCNGSVCIATNGTKNCFSKFSSDMAIALISLDACAEILDGSAGYTVKLEEIYTRDGINPHKIQSTSLIRSILLPLGMSTRSVYKKLRPRRSLEFSSLNSAVTVNKYNKVKVALGGIDPGPVVAEGLLPFDKEEFIRKTIKKARTVDNDVYTREYRKEMALRFLSESFHRLELI